MVSSSLSLPFQYYFNRFFHVIRLFPPLINLHTERERERAPKISGNKSMVLLLEKLGRSLKFPSTLEDRRFKSDATSSSLSNFRSKISEFIAGILLPGSELSGFNKCFDLIHAITRAFAAMAVEIDYPMAQWGPNLTDDYLNCTSDFLGLLNAVASSVSHLNLAKMSLRHAVSCSPPSAAPRLSKIAAAAHKLKFERAVVGMGEAGAALSPKEHALLHALALCRKIGSLALGFVVSGLCGDVEPYLEIRRTMVEVDDPLLKDADSRFYRGLTESKGAMMKEVREVNAAIDRISADGSYEDLKRRLKVLENSLEAVETQANDLFSQVFSARNKLLGNIRFPDE